MNTIIEKTESKNIDGVSKITLDTFQDFRGEIWTLYSKEYCDYDFVADKITISRFGSLRGFHGDEPAVVVVPPGCINAHLCLSDKCVFYYKWSKEYSGPDSQVTVAWNDSDIGVDWMIKSPMLSERDKNGKKLKEIRL